MSDFELTKAVCATTQAKLALIPPMLEEAAEAIKAGDAASVLCQLQAVLTVVNRLTGYFEGVQEGI